MAGESGWRKNSKTALQNFRLQYLSFLFFFFFFINFFETILVHIHLYTHMHVHTHTHCLKGFTAYTLLLCSQWINMAPKSKSTYFFWSEASFRILAEGLVNNNFKKKLNFFWGALSCYSHQCLHTILCGAVEQSNTARQLFSYEVPCICKTVLVSMLSWKFTWFDV